MFQVVLKILEGSILLKDEISVVLHVSLAGLNFSIKTNSFSILQLINLMVKIPFMCVYVFILLQRSVEISGFIFFLFLLIL